MTIDTRARLINCFKAVFPALDEEEITNAHYTVTRDWDSIGAINLIAIIEEEFDLPIPPDDMSDMDSFVTILNYLNAKATAA